MKRLKGRIAFFEDIFEVKGTGNNSPVPFIYN
jgi:hypothetical protein